MRSFQIGVMLPLNQTGPERTTARWSELRAMALRAEELGFDTVWTPDELLWLHEDAAPQGVWEGVAMAGAVAAVTSTVTVGTWVLSALHRNAGITAKVAETLDEISGGRFIFGLGAGHTWPGQAHAFGLPEDAIFARFDEALQVIVPLMREGRADFEGTYHAARGLQQNPVGPRPGKIPLLIGGNGPKGQRHAVRYADIWSGWIEDAVSVEEMGAKITSLEAICAEEGRDPVDHRPVRRVRGGRPGTVRCASGHRFRVPAGDRRHVPRLPGGRLHATRDDVPASHRGGHRGARARPGGIRRGLSLSAPDADRCFPTGGRREARRPRHPPR